MTAALLERPSLFDWSAPPAPDGQATTRGAADRDDRRATLEELLTAALHEARTNGGTECPVCHAAMASTGARGDGAALADCAGCGSRLS